jgi:hypothetical protein
VVLGQVAEAEGNRTPLTEILGHNGFEDRGGHQAPLRLLGTAGRAAVGRRADGTEAEPGRSHGAGAKVCCLGTLAV